MENPQMGMPAEMAPQGPNPEEMAIYEQMRQEISPQEFSNEMLAGASQVDPQAVAEFTQELQGLDMPPEALDALNDVVDEILANPERYDELRTQYMEQGLPEDILPEQFDPQFFAALNMAIDQMIAAPTGVQAFAKGGIAELKPIAKAIASYGRNGDTMLAHITPAEARMLRRRGGSGTINPKTGLPEFFLKKLFKGVGKALKSVGRAVKKFAQSSIGRIVLPIALGFFLGPAAASFMGVGSAAGVAAVSGFVGSAGSSLLAGGNLKDALKAGAIGGLTAGATAGVLNGTESFASGSYTGPTTVGGQVDAFKGMLPGSAPVVDAPAPVPGTGPQGVGPNQMPVPDAPSAAYDLNIQAQPAAAGAQPAPSNSPAAIPGSSAAYDPATATRAVDYGYKPGGTGTAPAYKPGGPTIGESFSKMGEGLGMGEAPASFDTFKQGATDLFSPGPTNSQLTARAREIMVETPGTSLKDAMTMAKEMSPSMLRTYGPAAVAGIGAMSAFGGFDSKPVQGGAITESLVKPVTQRIREDGTQRQMYLQGLPGVKYDEYGAPIFGESTRLPTYDVPDYNSGGYGMYGQEDLGGMSLPSVYTSPSGSIGSRRVEQPYNNSDMYSNIMSRRYAGGGDVQYYADGGVAETTDIFKRVLGRDPTSAEFDKWQPIFKTGMDVKKWTAFTEDPTIATEQKAYNTRLGETQKATEDSQFANRTRVAQEKALRKSQGSANMYANMNAGLAALAPETNPMDTADTTFGSRNRQAQLANLQQAYGPMLEGQRNARQQQEQALGQPSTPIPSPYTATPPVDRYGQMVQDQYARIGRTGFGGETSQIDIPGFNNFVNELQTGKMRPEDLTGRFDAAVQNYMRDKPDDRYTKYVQEFQRGQQPKFLNMGGIAGLAKGGYPRRNGQISGPGTEKSDSIPAMLSDGEFVMTAAAVRGAGKGSRRAGAKQMYKLMHQLEKNSQRG